jgi:G3E family GTPase
MVPVHVVAGFLGTGKTTVIRNLLASLPAGERVGLIVNDFGTAELDATALSAAEIRSIPGACLCCTAPAGFAGALRELLDAGVDRVIVEPTGIARPADLIDTLRRLPWRDRFALRPLIVVVDPAQLDDARRAQAEVADILVVNRIDLAPDLAATKAWIAGLWPGPAQVYFTSFGQLPATVLDALPTPAIRPVARQVPEESLHARSWTWPPEVVLERKALHAALAAPGLIRAKGRIHTDEGFASIERAGSAVHDTPTGWRRDSRLDAIAHDPAALDALDAALSAANVLRSANTGFEVVSADGRATPWTPDALARLPGLADVSAAVPGRAGAAASLAALLADAPSDALAVVVAADGFVSEPTPVAALKTGFLVYALDGAPLPANQGGPLRLLLPPGAATSCANVKAVVRIAIRS